MALLCTTSYAVRRKLITEDMIHHGFLNRLLLIWDEGFENFITLSERILTPNNIPDNLASPDPDTERVLNWGKKIHELDVNSIMLVPSQNALEKMKNIEIKMHEMLKKLDEVERGVRERCIVH